MTHNANYGQLWVSQTTQQNPTHATIQDMLTFTDENGVDHTMGDVVKRLEKMEERLCILTEPTPEKLEQYKMLKEAYTKYKFIEELIGKEDDE